jgi:hypothetical protein
MSRAKSAKVAKIIKGKRTIWHKLIVQAAFEPG